MPYGILVESKCSLVGGKSTERIYVYGNIRRALLAFHNDEFHLSNLIENSALHPTF